VTLTAARPTRTLRHLPLTGLQGSCQPYHSLQAEAAESVDCCVLHHRHPHSPPTTTRHTTTSRCRSHSPRLFLHFLSHPLNHLVPHRRRAHYPAPTATSFACDSPAKSYSQTELRLLQLVYALTFTSLARRARASPSWNVVVGRQREGQDQASS
jgi:hypothetical protein